MKSPPTFVLALMFAIAVQGSFARAVTAAPDEEMALAAMSSVAAAWTRDSGAELL